ncbi:MAG TPA: hypothetical protein VL326_25725, partial [Kofleriaceae bacterium]|nr:hypothetical protein [Kofleriaceae bacterium]
MRSVLAGSIAVAIAMWLAAASCATTSDTVSNTEPPTPHTVRTHEPSPPDEAAQHAIDCDKGDAAACHGAALDHYYKPSPVEDAKALELFRKACDLGYAPSCNGVGT